jgi:hypothetical protein
MWRESQWWSQQYSNNILFLFTKYHNLTLLSFESFHIGLVREMFTARQSTVNEATRGIRRSIPMTLCGLLSNLLWYKHRYLEVIILLFYEVLQKCWKYAGSERINETNREQQRTRFKFIPWLEEKNHYTCWFLYEIFWKFWNDNAKMSSSAEDDNRAAKVRIVNCIKGKAAEFRYLWSYPINL